MMGRMPEVPQSTALPLPQDSTAGESSTPGGMVPGNRPIAPLKRGNLIKRFGSKLYHWVALMMVVGAVLGHFWPAAGVALQPVAEGFINLIRMLIPPVILCTVVLGIAGAGGIRKAGRVGAMALVYFEIVSTFALVLGLL